MLFKKTLRIVASVAILILTLGGFTVADQANPNSLLEGLVAYWPFNEGEGDIVFDHSGYENHGIVSNVSWVYGRLGLALKFTGSAYVTIPFDPSLEPENLSLSLWIYPTPIENDNETMFYAVIRKDHGWSNGWRLLYDYRPGQDGKAMLQINFGDDKPRWRSSKAKFANRWVHLVWTYDKRQIRMYVDGTLDNFYEEDRSINYKQSRMLIGHPEGRFEGIIDEVRIYNRALSEEEISELYEQGLKE